MKLLPLVFYLLVFEPEGDKIKAAAITVALAFATFENVCYLIQNGADRFSFIFFRGFGTGAMHVLCGLIVGGGLAYEMCIRDRHTLFSSVSRRFDDISFCSTRQLVICGHLCLSLIHI